MTLSEARRFWAKVDRSGECWLWRATTDGPGYGFFRIAPGVMRRAHRIAWEMIVGPIPLGMCLLHRCDTPGCVRPAHLFLGTRHGKAQLTAGQVIAARAMRADGEKLQVIADTFGVATETISALCHRRSWSHV